MTLTIAVSWSLEVVEVKEATVYQTSLLVEHGDSQHTAADHAQTLLDVSSRTTIETAAELELPKDGDSVQSLANLASKDGLITFAGINSSQADQDGGQNQHLRSFSITYPPNKRRRTEDTTPSEDDKSAITPLGQRSLFTTSAAKRKETYQRITRLSPAQRRESGSKRICAIATGLAKDAEIFVFNATVSAPEPADIITRIDLSDAGEANDLDIAEPNENEFSLAYCTDYDVFEQNIQYNFQTKKAEFIPNGPRRIHQIPLPDAVEDRKSRSKFRGLRFLTPQNVLTVSNKPNKGGAELKIYHLYPTGPAALVLEKTLPSRIKQVASGSLDVCALDADKDGNRQVVVAVAGQDISIDVFTINYNARTDTFDKFKSFTTLRLSKEHPQQLTRLCFTPFQSPVRAPPPEPPQTGANGEPIPEKTETPNHPGPQYIRLASVSYGNTVVVDTFSLSPLEPQKRESRYVLSHAKDEAFTRNMYILLIAFIGIVCAFLAQSYITRASDSGNGLVGILPPGAREFISRPANVAEGFGKSIVSAADEAIPSSVPGRERLFDLIHTHAIEDYSTKALVVRDGGEGTELSVDVHPDREAYLKEDANARHWHELHEHERAAWREKLVRAGHWSANYGETLLKGVLFSEYAGMVGGLAADALRG